MLKEMEILSHEEKTLLNDALPLVTALIAGADGSVEVSELKWAEKLTDIRSYSNEPELNGYYEEVSKNFDQRLSYLVDIFPAETAEGTRMISEKLAELNPILAKLPQALAAKFYKSLKSFAKHIARADGGFLKMWSISKEEANLIDLPMLTPIETPEER